MNDDKQKEQLNIKRFGYVISAILIIISNISLINRWPLTPVFFLITMYFLTAALWIPSIIKPFYKIFEKFFLKNTDDSDSSNSKDIFSKN